MPKFSSLGCQLNRKICCGTLLKFGGALEMMVMMVMMVMMMMVMIMMVIMVTIMVMMVVIM